MKTSRYLLTSFKELKKVFENEKAPSNTVPARVKSDEEIFRDAMADVREIKEFRELPLKKPARIIQKTAPVDDSPEMLRQIIQGKRKIKLSDTGEYIEWVSPHIRKDITQRLHEGHFSVQDFIDLHGMTVDEAEQALNTFFSEAIRKRLFCIKVIHGRGLRSAKGPVLKEALKKWLCGRFRKWILAYSTAKDCDGGLGATYIILKSRY
ncbi:MAG: Smr/MutS family protein [Nitrospirota bacterium]